MAKTAIELVAKLPQHDGDFSTSKNEVCVHFKVSLLPSSAFG